MKGNNPLTIDTLVESDSAQDFQERVAEEKA